MSRSTYAFSTNPMDYPSMGMPAPLYVLDMLWYVSWYLNLDQLSSWADAICVRGDSDEQFVKDMVESGRDFLKMHIAGKNIPNTVNFGSLANTAHLLKYANPNWISNEDKQLYRDFIAHEKHKALCAFCAILCLVVVLIGICIFVPTMIIPVLILLGLFSLPIMGYINVSNKLHYG